MTKAPQPAASGEIRRALTSGPRNRQPLYYQIYLILSSKIYDGEYGQAEYLPSERELSEQFKVSRITAIKALNELAANGLVVRERGRGTRVQFVAKGTVARGPVEALWPALLVDPAPGDAVEDFLHHLNAREPGEFTVHDFAYVAAPPAAAAALHLPAGAEVQYATRVVHFAGQASSHLTTYVPADIGRYWTRKQMETTPLQRLMGRAGVRVERVDERVTATLAEVTATERLAVPTGSPLIKIMRTEFDAAERPVEFLVGLYPPDRYQYAVSLTNTGTRARLHGR